MRASDRKFRRPPRKSFLLISWVVGMVLCTVMVGLLKYYGIYENASWFTVMSIPLFGFVIFPGFVAVMTLLFSRLERWLAARPKKKPNKMTIRKRRIAKLFAPFAMCWALLLMICFAVTSALTIYIGRLYVPGYNSDEDLLITIPLLVFFFIITISPVLFLSTVIYARLFIKKKGKIKSMKYLCEWKKPPGILKTVWLRACGINQQDIQEYLRDYLAQ